MKALSLHQPYASLIACGAKRIETRGWARAYRGPIAIHAAKKWGMKEADNAATFRVAFGLILPPPLPLGVVAAVAELADVRQMDEAWIDEQTDQEFQLGGWEVGRHGWVLENVRPLARPLPLKGRQGLWTLNEAEAAEVLRRAKKP